MKTHRRYEPGEKEWDDDYDDDLEDDDDEYDEDEDDYDDDLEDDDDEYDEDDYDDDDYDSAARGRPLAYRLSAVARQGTRVNARHRIDTLADIRLLHDQLSDFEAYDA